MAIADYQIISLDQARDILRAFPINSKCFDVHLFYDLLKICSDCQLNTLTDYLEWSSYVLILLRINTKYSICQNIKLQPLIDKARTDSFWKSSQLQHAYLVFFDYLCFDLKSDFQVKSLEKGGGILDNEMNMLGLQVPNLYHHASLALIALYLGVSWHDDELVQSALRLVSFVREMSDHKQRVFDAVWMSSDQYCRSELYEMSLLLFAVSDYILVSNSTSFCIKQVKCFGSPFLQCMYEMFQEKLGSQNFMITEYQNSSDHITNHSLGFIKYSYQNFSCICTASGLGSGLGSIHKNDVKIINFGPHQSPLFDSSQFGVSRFANASVQRFQDVLMETETDQARFKGWTHVFEKPSDSTPSLLISSAPSKWMFFDCCFEKCSMHLSARLDSVDTKNICYMVFFISADQGLVDDHKTVLPGSISAIEGDASKWVFSRKDDQLVFETKNLYEYKLIPLSEGDHFFGASFLLAFPLRKSMDLYHWSVW